MSVADLPTVVVAADPSSPAGPPALKGKHRGRSLLLSYLLTVFVLVTANFFLPRTLPGDPIAAIVQRSGNTQVRPEVRARLNEYYGFDRPLMVQYGHYLAGLAQGDLGYSIRYSVPVRGVVFNGAKWTALLVVGGLALSVPLGMVAGIHAGWRRGRRADKGLLGFLIAIGNFPVYVVASLALVVFAIKLQWLPFRGAQDGADMRGFAQVLDIGRHLLLPASVMALQYIFLTFLVMRGSMVGELGADYLLMGRAKGVSDRRLKYRYAARNALLPVMTVVALDIGIAVSGSIFVERVFAYRGLGFLMFESIAIRDYPMMQGCFLLFSMVVVTVNLLTDLLYPRLDPRVAA